MMDRYIFAGICLVSFLNVFALAGLIFAKSERNMAALRYVTWAVCVCFWLFFLCVHTVSDDAEVQFATLKLLHFWAILIPVAHLHFVYSYAGKTKNWVLHTVYVLTFFFEVLNCTPYLVTMGRRDVFGFPTPIAQPLYPLFIATLFFSFLYSLRILFDARRSAFSRSRKNEITAFLASTIIAYIGGSTVFLINYEIKIYPIFPYAIMAPGIYAVIIGFIILKYQFLDVRLVIKKTLVFTATFFTLSCLAAVVIYAVCQWVFTTHVHSLSLVTGAVGFGVMFMLFKPVDLLIQRFLEKRIFKGSIGEILEQRKKLEEELQRSERLKSVGILAAGVAHEIKNPITTLKTFLEYFPEKQNDPVFRENFLRLAGLEIQRVEDMVKNLLGFSKPSEPVKVVFALNPLVQETLDMLSPKFAKHGIQVVFERVLEPEVSADRNQIKQVIMNIVMNAVDALKGSPEPRQITLRSQKLSGGVKLAIHDNGPGISPEARKHIFDPFYSQKEEGTGLGLAISYWIMEKHDGKIEVNSSSAKGVEFVLSL